MVAADRLHSVRSDGPRRGGVRAAHRTSDRPLGSEARDRDSAIASGVATASLAALTPQPIHLCAVFAVLGLASAGSSAFAHARVAMSWTAVGCAAAVGPVLVANAFDATGSYSAPFLLLALVTIAVAPLSLTLPDYWRVRDAA